MRARNLTKREVATVARGAATAHTAMVRLRWRWALVALLCVGLSGAGTRSVSRHVLFPASEVARLPTPSDVVTHTLEASDRVPVHAIELPAPPGARTVVHFHNNRETVEACLGYARALHARGLGVLLVEYRGYGASTCVEPDDFAPSEEGLYLDAEAGLGMLAARGVGPERIVLSGTSLGTGVAAEMARRGRGSRLVLVTPYTSIPDIVTDAVPLVPAGVLMPDHFDTLSKAGEIQVPTLVVHGDADEIVPFWMGEALARALPNARFIDVPGGRHDDLFVRDGDHLLDAIAAMGG